MAQQAEAMEAEGSPTRAQSTSDEPSPENTTNAVQTTEMEQNSSLAGGPEIGLGGRLTSTQENKTQQSPQQSPEPPFSPSMTLPLFAYWVIPVLMLSIFSRFAAETNHDPPVPQPLPAPQPRPAPQPSPLHRPPPRPRPTPDDETPFPTMPTSYNEILKEIRKKRRLFSDDEEVSRPSGEQMKSKRPTSAKSTETGKSEPRGASTDPARIKFNQQIDELRKESKNDPNDLFKLIQFGDALRQYDVQYHDGGTRQEEALQVYNRAIDMAEKRRQNISEEGKPTNLSLSGTTNVNEEIMMDYSAKSADGLLCALYTARAKVFFMANMFEKAVESYSSALDIEPLYLDALGSRGTSEIILGRYEDAARDFALSIEHDTNRLFVEAFTGLAKVLIAKKEAVPQGWEPMVEIIEDLIPKLEDQANIVAHEQTKKHINSNLNRLHHVLFQFHDAKTKDRDLAWYHLSESYRFKMASLSPWRTGVEAQKIAATKQIFHTGFWQQGIGSQTKVPIFIVGFVRSGSTLLERILDAHPQIVGTGENSVFNGRLDHIRNKIVEVSLTGENMKLYDTVRSLADGVVEEMRKRWEMLDTNSRRDSGSENETRSQPERFVDKMLTNYYNIGFIHLLFPNALILHVVRNPMDTLFSAYKHEFPPGTLDYTSDFSSLAELYHSYRDLIDHWDKVLPNRVSHVMYEDIVHDMPGVARAIIRAAGLEWDNEILDFHKKKQAVNTLSTSQVRKGIYRDSLQSWKKYEKQLQPLVKLVGDRVDFDLKTSLPGYSRLPPAAEEGRCEVAENNQKNSVESDCS